nr:chemotaxis protein CheC [Sulfobacillus harzensis]
MHAGATLKKFSGLDFVVKDSHVAIATWSTAVIQIQQSFTNPFYGVYVEATGLLPSTIILGFSPLNAQRLVSALMEEEVELPLNDMGLSALQEVGNIVGTAYLNVFSDLLGTVWEPKLPQGGLTSPDEFVHQMTSAALVLLAEALFEVPSEGVLGRMLVIPAFPE